MTIQNGVLPNKIHIRIRQLQDGQRQRCTESHFPRQIRTGKQQGNKDTTLRNNLSTGSILSEAKEQQREPFPPGQTPGGFARPDASSNCACATNKSTKHDLATRIASTRQQQ